MNYQRMLNELYNWERDNGGFIVRLGLLARGTDYYYYHYTFFLGMLMQKMDEAFYTGVISYDTLHFVTDWIFDKLERAYS